MARIRTIKPEFPQSESMGRVSRDARLLFVLMWTVADDVGRLRGDSRMLARILYPYDDGEDGHIKTTGSDVDSWLRELEREGCIARYVVDGKAYVQIVNWAEHQKIDKPSKSKLPPLDESSRILANPRESSRVFSPQQTRTREGSAADQDQGKDQGKDLDHTYAREESTARNGRNHVDAYAEFQRIKAAYPKFAGRQDWINAQAHVTALVEDGEATYDELIDAVTRYAAYIRAKGSEGTQFVKSPGRFFEGRTADAYWRQTWEPPAAVNGKALTRFDRVFGDGEPEVDEHGNKIQF